MLLPPSSTPAPAEDRLIRREYGPEGHYVLTGRALERLRESQLRIEPLLRSVSVRRTHLPVLVPPLLTNPVRDWLNPELRKVVLTTHGSDQPKGWYPTAGLCLRGLPLVAKQRFSWRDLPVGYWTGGPAVAPVAGSGPDAEDLVCVDGLLAEPQERQTDLAALIGRILTELDVPAEPAPETWALKGGGSSGEGGGSGEGDGGTALVWRHDGRVTASLERLPAAAAKQYSACYMDADNRLQPLSVSFFHISQYALLRGTEVTAR
ncbi:hypothetical protein ACFC1R_18590 [Kitasatospora sp. NPDC056138]|uniref:hypothetical protein n=1 Tax=Kitasatospora sp. NPDC056138 TaxID=3345724 RepID=UPI0035E3823E